MKEEGAGLGVRSHDPLGYSVNLVQSVDLLSVGRWGRGTYNTASAAD